MATYLHPGVYVEEIPSGSRPIEGVAMSVAAFVGAATRGPVGEAQLIHSFEEFTEAYGGVEKKAVGDTLGEQENAMVLAVRSFYLNGGKSAYICRLAKEGTSQAAFLDVEGENSGGQKVLRIKAASVGAWGNAIHVRIHKPDPDQTDFDIEVGHLDKEGQFVLDEEFLNVTLNSHDDDYILTRINGESKLIKVSLLDPADPESGSHLYEKGSLTGGQMSTANTHFKDNVADTMSMQIDIDGRGPKLVTIRKTELEAEGDWDTNNDNEGGVIAAHIQDAVRNLGGYTRYLDFKCEYKKIDGLSKFVLTSGLKGDFSSVEVLDGDESASDLAHFLRLDSEQKASHTGGAVAPGTNVRNQFQDTMVLTFELDGKGETDISIKKEDMGFTDNDVANRHKIAAAIQSAVQQHEPEIPSFADFRCEYDEASRKYTLTSGSSRSRASSVAINNTTPAGNTNLSGLLKLAAGPSSFSGRVMEHGTWKVIAQYLPGTGGNGEHLDSGSADAPEASDYASFFSNTLRKVRDASILLLPGLYWNKEMGNMKISHALAHCESTKRCVLIVDPPKDVELEQGAQVRALGLPTSTYSVLYYPWADVPNPLYNADTAPNEPKTLPAAPSAFAAGMWSKIDGSRGVWKAPAGTETRLYGLTGLQFKVEDGEQDQLNPLGVNCYRKQPGYGSVIWGSRTLSTKANPEWRYVPVRRTAIYIEQSIYNGIQWAVFEPNDEPLWSSLRGNIGDFMNGMFRSGAFQGAKVSDAYFVRCGLGDTMTQADIDRGQVIVLVGFAPLKPAEFVIVRIQQKVQQ